MVDMKNNPQTPIVSGGSHDEEKPNQGKTLAQVTAEEQDKQRLEMERQNKELANKTVNDPAGRPFSLGKSDVSNVKPGNVKAEMAMIDEDKRPSKSEADKLMDKKAEENRLAQEEKNKEIQAELERKQKEEEYEKERQALLQRAANGEAVSIPASRKIDRYNTEDGLPPRYEAGNLEPVNAKKPVVK